ncbi:MAG: LuxR C-terminal-related transcriptional regulator [Gemmatimonadaceae bacterium]
MSAGPLQRAREAFGRRAWGEAFAALSTADRQQQLAPEDLELLATAAYLTGHFTESADGWTRAHGEFLTRGNPARAARCAIRLGVDLMNAGERVRGDSWVARARRILEKHPSECVEHGYVLLPTGVRRILEGDVAEACALFQEAAEIGRRFGEPDLITMARHGVGRAKIRSGSIDEGLALLDEAMVALEAGDVSPLFAGDIYCSVIEACFEVFDVRRAREWTAALAHWCDSQPDLVPYTGQCLVRRAEIMQLHGQWAEASDVARDACAHFQRWPEQPAVAAAFYQQGELQRLRGDLSAAEASYRETTRRGRNAQPGLALLRLAQGQVEAATSFIRIALEQARGRPARCRLLPAFTQIMLEAKDVDAARAAADELTQLADSIGAPLLLASAAQATGAVALASGDAGGALEMLRRSWTAWQELRIPHEAARTRVLIALTLRSLGDEDAAEVEFDAARWAFDQLAATSDVDRVTALAGSKPQSAARSVGTVLTGRELQVLRLIAAGHTNRAIGGELDISEKTVARHVSNIFTKLGVNTRAAATAYAYQNGLS